MDLANPTPPPSVVAEAERLLADITPSDFDVFDEADAVPEQRGNVAFIAAAPRLVRALVAEVRRLEAFEDVQAGCRLLAGAYRERDTALARAEKAEAEAARLRAAIEAHRGEYARIGHSAGANRALWAALDNPEETTDA